MSPISIVKKDETDSGWIFTVETPAGTTHEVALSEKYYREITDESVKPEKLIWASFSFLLRRESSEEIMSAFSLSDISTYFPEYREVITEELHSDEK